MEKERHSIKSLKKTDTLAIPDDTVPKIKIPKNAIRVGEEYSRKSDKMRILDGSDFNQQEGVGSKDSRLKWVGLFSKKKMKIVSDGIRVTIH